MIKFLIIFSVMFYVTSGFESEITKSMKEFKIIPQIISSEIPELLKVTFENGIIMNMGNNISAFQARNQPKVDWSAAENTFYLLLAFDIDGPSSVDPYISPVLTWMVGNIPGKDIDSGENLATYIPSSSPKGTGFHRVVFLLYEQPGKLEFNEKLIDEYNFKDRINFNLNDHIKNNGLLGPVAGNFYLTEFDDYVLKIYKQLNCCFEYNK